MLRNAHDAILVGVGTVLADDPELTVRMVDGRDPQPIVVDSQLRTPPTAKLLSRRRDRPWIGTVIGAANDCARAGAGDAPASVQTDAPASVHDGARRRAQMEASG